jgi:hypothetical protein
VKYAFQIGLFLLTASLVFNSCEKKRNDEVGFKGDGPGFPELTLTDTFTIYSSTVREDSIRTDELSQFLLGRMNDPLFGISTSSIFTQLNLPQLNRTATNNPTLDSAFIYVIFTSKLATYGNLNSVQSFKVHELTEGFNKATYYSSDELSYNPTPVGSYAGVFNLNDSLKRINNGQVEYAGPGVKIALSSDFAEKLLNAKSTDVSTHQAFKEYIYGLAFIPDNQPASGEGAVVALNLKNTASKIYVYYNGGEQIDFNFADASTSVKTKSFTQYKFENQAPEITVQKNNTSGNYDTVFVQSFTGAKAHFRFPGFFNLISQENIFLHKVEFQIPIIPETVSSQYPAPSKLLMLQPHPETNLNFFVLDFTDTAKYNGNFDKNANTYRFNLTKHFMELVNEYKRDPSDPSIHRGLFLTPTRDFPITPARAIIDSRSGSNEKLKLIVMYSKL